MQGELVIDTPEWAEPLLPPCRYKGIKGGRASGKSHFFGELLTEEHIANPNQRSVCIREIQKSLKFSAKSLLEQKIKAFGVSHLFDITQHEIRDRRGDGVIIFQGMQDHTADSIQSLEGFDRAWCEEAHRMSARSIRLLRPTIRKRGSEMWFSWNPNDPSDAVEELLVHSPPEKSIVIHANYTDNIFISDEVLEEVEHDRKANPDTFGHVWLGEYNTRSDIQVFKNKWEVTEFEPDPNFWDGPYYGLDFGFSQDPTAAVECWIYDGVLYIYREGGRLNLELDDTAEYLRQTIPGICDGAVRADSARPESISFLRRHGIPRIEPVKKWPGSVEDGVEFLKTFRKIAIHVQCQAMQREARLYSYKVNRGGDVLNQIQDDHNHYWDAVRYALAPLIKSGNQAGALF